MLKLHYPERLDAFWFLNAPTIFWALWRVVGPMVRRRREEFLGTFFFSAKKKKKKTHPFDFPLFLSFSLPLR